MSQFDEELEHFEDIIEELMIDHVLHQRKKKMVAGWLTAVMLPTLTMNLWKKKKKKMKMKMIMNL